MIKRDAFFIDGQWTTPAGTSMLEVRSPITEEVIGRFPESTAEDINVAVAAARRAFESGPWPHLTVKERGEYLLAMASLLEPRLQELIDLQVDEMGGPCAFVRMATLQGLNAIPHQLTIAESIELSEVRDGNFGKVVVFREPIGVTAGIIPWNGPVVMVIEKMLPALLSGCPIVIKPDPQAPLSAYLVAEVAAQVELPAGVFNLVPGGREVGQHLVTHPDVNRVTFTGSSAAGAQVAALCGEQIKRVTLELGGKSAAIVLPDADFEGILPTLIGSSMLNNGQACHATTRILSPAARSAELVELLVEAVRSMKVGNPHDPDVAFGPLISARQREKVESYILSGRDDGAIVALGGGRPSELPSGWYVEPTIFTKVDNGMKIAQEEIFGPVVCLIDYDGEDEAIKIANDSNYGLGGAVFTSDVGHGLEIARQIKTGTCRINEAPPGGGGGPFGGVKRSGIGRERDREGIESYFELKSVTIPSGFVPSFPSGSPAPFLPTAS